MSDLTDRARSAGARLARHAGVLVIVLIALVAGFLLRSAFVADSPAPALDAAHGHAGEEKAPTVWTCSMHPQIRSDKPGKCPICHMDLIPVEPAATASANPREFTTSPAARALMDIETSPVERRFVSAEVRMVGKVDYDETRLAYISAWVPGRLDRLYVDYTGVPVREGDHLVSIYSPELLSAQEELLQARRSVETIQDSDSALVRRSTDATYAAAREKLRLLGLSPAQIEQLEQSGKPSDHLTIESPASGIVIHKDAREGMYVQTGTRIYTIADLSRMWIRLEAYESDLAWLRYGQPVEFTAVSYPGEAFRGTIAFIDPILDPVTRTVKVRVNVPNEDGRLKPGMFVKAVVRSQVAAGGRVMEADLAGKWICPMHPEIVKGEPGECDICGMPLVRTESLGYVSADAPTDRPLVIPATAPLLTGTRAVVYVEVPETDAPTYEGREVALGPRAGDWYLVASGLSEGERVVTRGNFKIDSALQIAAKPSMMSPEGGQPMTGHAGHGGAAPATAAQTATAQADAHNAAPPARTEPVNPKFLSQLAPLYTAYFAVSTALANDDLPAARGAAKNASAALERVDMNLVQGKDHDAWMQAANALGKILPDLAAAEDIESARKVFALHSEQMLALAQRFGSPLDGPVYQAYCPMAFDNRGGTWLQDHEDILNPYFGDAMLRCGEIQAEIPPATTSDTHAEGQHDE